MKFAEIKCNYLFLWNRKRRYRHNNCYIYYNIAYSYERITYNEYIKL